MQSVSRNGVLGRNGMIHFHLYGIQKFTIWYTKYIELENLSVIYLRKKNSHIKRGEHNVITTLGSVNCLC